MPTTSSCSEGWRFAGRTTRRPVRARSYGLEVTRGAGVPAKLAGGRGSIPGELPEILAILR